MKGTLYVVSIAGVNSAGVGNFTEEVSRRTAFDSEYGAACPLNISFTVLTCRCICYLKSCDIHVTSPGPSAPRNLRDFVVNSQSAIVRWEPSANNGGSPLLNYRVELRVAGGAYITIDTVSHPTQMYELTLQPETNYM